MIRPLKCSLAVAALLSLSACKGGSSSPAGAGDSPVVARVDDAVITVQQFKAKLEEQPSFVRSRYTSLESKKEFLDNLVRFEVLVQEARRQGLDKDPEVQSTLQKLMVQRLIQKQAAASTAQTFTEEEFNAFYQAHLAEFVRPERLRVSHLYLASASSDPKRNAVKSEADALLADVRRREAGPDKTAFGAMVRTRSDDAASKSSDGDLGFKTKEELAAAWGSEVADAAFGLKTVGEVVEVASPRGLHLLKLSARQPGMNQPLDSVRPRIESRLALEKRAHSVDEFTASLKGKAKVQVDEKVLGDIQVDVDGVGTAQPSPP